MPIGDMIYWDHYYNGILLCNLLIVIGLFTCLRLFSGTIAHIDAWSELFRKDNPAFGISLAGAAFAVTIMLSGTFYGQPGDDILSSVLIVGGFGMVGIILMAVTRIIFDRFTLPSVSLRDEIVKGNYAVAIADAGNVLAAAIIIRALMVWVVVHSWSGILIVLAGYVVSQALLTGMSLVRMRLFRARHGGTCIQDELKKGNTALGLRFAGQKIGTAFAIATAAQIVVYEQYDLLPIMGAWLVASLIVIAIWKIVSWIAHQIIFFRVDFNHEVVAQGNIAVGALQAVIYAAMGLLIATL